MIEEDDDIQQYVRSWAGLTDVEIEKIAVIFFPKSFAYKTRLENEFAKAIEAKLKEKNT